MRHGSHIDPPNRFEQLRHEPELSQLENSDWDWDQEHRQTPERRKIEYLVDSSQSVVSENHSPDIPFRYSVNPYRGCVHGCAYCYARPGHEYLGFNAGLDFETKIVVKPEAPELLRKFLAKKSWAPEPITFSGVTDCYQPVERELQLTRRCLEVAWKSRLPVSIVTKNALVVRDLDLLEPMAKRNLVHVFLSVTTLDPRLARQMEPRTSTPSARLRAVSELAQAEVPVGVMAAPLIPGLNDSQLPAVLEAAREAGAAAAGYILLRLPLTVEPVFLEWLERTHAGERAKIEGRIRDTRGGERLNSSAWGERLRGAGELAGQIRSLFQVLSRKHGLDRQLPSLDCEQFQRPAEDPRQGRLF